MAAMRWSAGFGDGAAYPFKHGRFVTGEGVVSMVRCWGAKSTPSDEIGSSRLAIRGGG